MRKAATVLVCVMLAAIAGGAWQAAIAQSAGAPKEEAPQSLIPKTVTDKAGVPDAAHLAAARKLMETTGAIREFDIVMPRVLAQLQQAFEQRAPQHAKAVAEVMQALAKKFAARQESLFNEVAAHYARTITLEDMTVVADFFAQPAGARYVAAVPTLMRGGITIGQEWAKKIGDELRKEAEAELKKRGVPL